MSGGADGFPRQNASIETIADVILEGPRVSHFNQSINHSITGWPKKNISNIIPYCNTFVE